MWILEVIFILGISKSTTFPTYDDCHEAAISAVHSRFVKSATCRLKDE